MNDDVAHLNLYTKTGSEDAFAAVVRQNLPLVYASALRRVGGNAARAQDVTQMVFIALARNAANLARHPDLTGWLFTTTRFLAANTLRSELRRQTREQEMHFLHALESDEPDRAQSAALHEVLDDVVADLRQIDRQIVLLRFYQGLRLAEIGAKLGATENAVQKRLDRALDQLRTKLGQRGMTSTSAALAVALEAHCATTLPVGLAVTTTGAAIACQTGAAGLLGISSLMLFSKIQVAAATAILLAASAGLMWEHRENARLRTEAASQNAAAIANTMALKKQLETQAARASSAEADVNALLTAIPTTTEKSRSSAPPLPHRASFGFDQLHAVSQRVGQLRREGKPQEALEECLRSYREARAIRPGSPENQILIGSIVGLSQSFPPATAALRQLREEALQEFQVNPADRNRGTEVAQLNLRLGENARTVALYDTLPPESPLRQSFSLIAYDAFVDARRYADAMVGKTFGNMLNELDLLARHAGPFAGPNQAGAHALVVGSAAKNIEVLTGAGQLSEARMLTEKLLAFDRSDATRALVQQHTERAGPPAR